MHDPKSIKTLFESFSSFKLLSLNDLNVLFDELQTELKRVLACKVDVKEYLQWVTRISQEKIGRVDFENMILDLKK